MAKVLSLFRRKGGPDGDVRAAPPAPPAPRPVPSGLQQSPPQAKARTTNDGDSGADAEGADVETVPDKPAAELVVARRQSQINLNKFLAAAPSGLTAVLKQPSRGDLEPARSQGSGSLGIAFAVQPSSMQAQLKQLQQDAYTQPGGVGGESPPVKPARERRRSMAAAELAASLQNIDVTQAAMIMMPARLKQELVGAQSSASQPLPSLQSVPAPVRSSAPLPAAILSADSYSLSAVLAGANGGAAASAAATAGSPGRLERKPSLIREAVKVQTQQQQPMQTRGAVASESQIRGQAMAGGSSGGDGPRGSPGQERGPGTTLATRRGSMAPALLQGGALSGGPSRASMAVGGMGGVGSPPSPAHGPSRRSEVGESGADAPRTMRTRGSVPLGFEPQGAAGLVMASNGGHPLSPTGNSNGGGYLLPSTASNKDLRRGGLATRASELMPASSSAADDDGQFDAVRLPVIGGNGTPTRRVAIDAKDPRERDAGPSVHSGGRGGLTAADVAALSEAISNYQTEAARLRAMAVRKVDSRIKRAVMDRRLTVDEDSAAAAGSLLDGGVAGGLLAPLLRGQPTAAAGNSRGNLQQPVSRGGPRGTAQAGGAGTGGSGGGGSGDPLARARTRLQETEAETAEELNQMKRNSNLAPRLIAAELLSDPSVPRRR